MALLDDALSKVPPWLLMERLENVARVDVSAFAQAVQTPTLYLRAASDRVVPRLAGEELVKAVPDITIRELEGPHFLLQACPGAAFDAIKSFALARVS